MPTLEPGCEAQKKFHSMCRWNKPKNELESFLKVNKGAEETIDEANGNRPIHIAAQNGHIDVVRLLIEHKVDLNAVNNAKNTALHMARAYDYYWCGQLITAGGANRELKNEAGHRSDMGIDGDKRGDDAVAALVSAHNAQQLNKALELIAAQQTVDKGQLVMAGMGKKKSAKPLWTTDVDAKFKALCKKF